MNYCATCARYVGSRHDCPGRITEERFTQATGRAPEQDDMERVNCDQAGTIGHSCCGWNHDKDLPQFLVGPRIHEFEPRASAEGSPQPQTAPVGNTDPAPSAPQAHPES